MGYYRVHDTFSQPPRANRIDTADPAGGGSTAHGPACGVCSTGDARYIITYNNAHCALGPRPSVNLRRFTNDRHLWIHTPQGLELDQAERRQVREHQPANLGCHTREGITGRPPPSAAVFAGHAEWR